MVAYRNQPCASAAEKRHLAAVKALPCCVCLPGEQRSVTEVHHCVRGNKRLGHFWVLPLCQFHHKNVSQLRHLERTHWELLNEQLGIERNWPESKICPRRVCVKRLAKRT